MARSPIIKKQVILREQLWGALQGDVIEKLRLVIEGDKNEFAQRSDMACKSLKVTENTMPDVYALFQEVKVNLDFTDDVELYIQADPLVNAYSYKSETFEKPHIIIITSALYNLMDEIELMNIIGHEIGHIINEDSTISKLYNFVYSEVEDEDIPEIIRTRYLQYCQLAEYAADRYGYLGCKDLNACISAFYKLNSGLDIKKMNVNVDSLTDENFNNINFLLESGAVTSSDHPLTPYRVQAIVEYAKAKSVKAMEENLEMLYSAIPGLLHSEADKQMALLLASSGVMLAAVDGKIDKTEKGIIIDNVAKYELEASKLLKSVMKGDVEKIMIDSFEYIKEYTPEKIEELVPYFVDIAFADGIILHEEIDHMLRFCETFNIGSDIVFLTVAQYIKDNYNTWAEAL